MKIKYSIKFLSLLENIFTQAGYTVRYEKGNFQAGYCLLNQQRIIVVNRYFALEGKINCLIEILKTVSWKFENLSDKEAEVFNAIATQNLKDSQISLEIE